MIRSPYTTLDRISKARGHEPIRRGARADIGRLIERLSEGNATGVFDALKWVSERGTRRSPARWLSFLAELDEKVRKDSGGRECRVSSWVGVLRENEIRPHQVDKEAAQYLAEHGQPAPVIDFACAEAEFADFLESSSFDVAGVA